tara:strand:- start:2225 stop:2701 length:477 start_codon:yes stop_codon:yes gene_type:complete
MATKFYAEINSDGYCTTVWPDDTFALNKTEMIELPADSTSVTGWRYKHDGSKWVDAFPAAKDDEILDELAKVFDAARIVDKKAALTARIKAAAKEKIEATDWKIQRATEADAVAGGTENLDAVYAQRAKIRKANNQHEIALGKLTKEAEIDAFDPAAF